MEYAKQLSTWWSGIIYHKEQLDALTSSTDIKSYTYILHDKCLDDNGEPKKPHYHYVVRFPRNARGSWFKQFSTEDMGQIYFKPVTYPQGAYDYLIHDTDDCCKKNKRLYDPSERISTIKDFDNPDDKKQSTTEKFFNLLHGGANNMELQKEFPTKIFKSCRLLYRDLHYIKSARVRALQRHTSRSPQRIYKPISRHYKVYRLL